MTMIRFIYFA